MNRHLSQLTSLTFVNLPNTRGTTRYFKREIVPLTGHDKDGNEVLHDRDEGIRPSTTAAGLAKLKPLKAIASKGKQVGVALTHSPTHPLIHSPNHSLPRSLTHSRRLD